MADQRVFFLSGGRLVVYHWRKNRLLEPATFAGDEAGLRAFSVYLESDPRTPAHMLVDFVEEEFREETVPHVFGTDRSALLRTRQTRLFRDARYSHAIMQGRESGGRRDDRVLFSALIRPDLLAPWLGQIGRHKVPLAGIYSLPILSQRLLKPLRVGESHVLLVSLQSTGGLRQSFFHEGQLRLSRLAVMPRLTLGQFASYILSEVEKVRRYLNSLRMLSRESPLDVYLLAHGDVLDDLRQQVSESITTRYRFVDVGPLSRKLGLRPPLQTPFSDLLFARLLVRDNPSNHYARSEERRYYMLHRARSSMLAASLVLLLGSLAWSGSHFIDSAAAKEDALFLGRQAAFFSERLHRARERLPPAPDSAEQVRLAVNMAEIVRHHAARPLPMLALISEGLAAHPELRVDSVDWAIAANPDAPVEVKARDRRRKRLAPPPGTPPGTRFQLAIVKGRVTPFHGDYRAALDSVNSFANSLTRLPGVEAVHVLSLPLNTSSTRQLQGTVESNNKIASFELRLAMRVPPPAEKAQ